LESGLNYYISGSDVYPHAITGLDKVYKLEADQWKHIEMTPRKICELVTDMHNTVRSLSVVLSLHGFALFDDKGNQTGVRYSILRPQHPLR
jgi:hypothetical protein